MDTYGLITKESPTIYPPMERKTLKIANKNGIFRFKTTLGERPINIASTLIVRSGRTDYKARLRDIAAWLSPLDGPKPLIFSDEPDKMYYAELADKIDVEDYVYAGKFTIPMTCTDPFIYAVNETEVVYTGAAVINNQGNQDVFPLFRLNLTGPVSNLTVTNQTTGESFVITGTLSSGSVVEVDRGYLTVMTAKLDNVNVLNRFSGEFIKLLPGNNTIAVSNSNAQLDLRFRGKWI